MLKTRKLISLLLVVAMMLSVFSVAIVSASAADGDEAIILYDGQEFKAHEGDTIRYKAYMDVRTIPTATDGRAHVVDGVTHFDQSSLTIVGEPDCYNVFSDPVVGTDEANAIYYTDQNIGRGFLLDGSQPMIDVTFKIDKAAGLYQLVSTNKLG